MSETQELVERKLENFAEDSCGQSTSGFHALESTHSRYWADKITLLWYSKRPPHYDAVLAKNAAEAMSLGRCDQLRLGSGVYQTLGTPRAPQVLKCSNWLMFAVEGCEFCLTATFFCMSESEFCEDVGRSGACESPISNYNYYGCCPKNTAKIHPPSLQSFFNSRNER